MKRTLTRFPASENTTPLFLPDGTIRFHRARLEGLVMCSLFVPLILGLSGSIQAQTNYQQIKSFGFLEMAGGNPNSPLVQGSDGAFYGTTVGGPLRYGTVFQISKDGQQYRALHQFNAAEGSAIG